jgi:hypothetical protein
MSKVGSLFFAIQELFENGYSTDYIVKEIMSEYDVTESFVINTIDLIRRVIYVA